VKLRLETIGRYRWKRRRLSIIVAGLLSLFCVGAIAPTAWADEPAAAQAPDKAVYTAFNPTPNDLERAFCTDRPTKSTGACTVDAGHFQLETDLINLTIDRSGGQDVNTVLFTNPTLKFGLTNSIDIEANLAPYERVETRDRTTGASTHAGGVGDLYLRAKLNLAGDDAGDFALAVSPFIKAPTAARGLGNGAVEEGLVAPMSWNLPQNWSLTVDPEADALKNSADGGRHLNLSGLVSLSRPLDKALTLSLELWSDLEFDPRRTVRQYSFDLGAAWISPRQPNFQLDCGLNLGLNSATPTVQVYTGVSQRY